MDIRVFLEEQYELRKQRNPRYTLRAFSRLLETDSGSIVKVLNGKRSPEKETIRKWLQCLKLDLDPEKFTTIKEAHFLPIDEAFFEKNYNWIHPIFMESLRIKNTHERKEMVCKSLQITPEDHDQILDLLLMQGLAKIDKKGHLAPQSFTTYDSPVTSEVRKQIQKEYLKLAMEAIDDVPYEHRCNSTVSVGISQTDLPAIKEILRKARMQIGAFAKNRKKPKDCVYNISTAIYPVIYEK